MFCCRPDGSDIMFTNDRELEEILNEEWNKPMPENHPPWMTYCIKGVLPAMNSPERHLENKTVVCFRIHHGYGDGISFCCVFLPTLFRFKLIGDSSKSLATLDNALKEKLDVERTCSSQSSDSGHGASSDGQPSDQCPSSSDSPRSTPSTRRRHENVDGFVRIDIGMSEELDGIDSRKGGVQATLATPGHVDSEVDSKLKDIIEMKAVKWYQVAMMRVCGELALPYNMIR